MERNISPNEKFKSLKYMHMFMIDKLTPTEFVVVTFIWARTVFWGKQTELIYFRHFLKGIPNTIAPLPIKERQLQNIIRSLVNKGVIYRKNQRYASVYGINWEWMSPENEDNEDDVETMH